MFPQYFPEIPKLERKDAQSPYDKLVGWFFDNEGLEIYDENPDSAYKKNLDAIEPLDELIEKHRPECKDENRYFLKELLLWGLVAHNKLSKHRFERGVRFKDVYGGYISRL